MIPWWTVVIVVFLDNSFIVKFISKLGAMSAERLMDGICILTWKIKARKRRRSL